MNAPRILFKILAPVVVLAGALGIAYYLVSNKPEARTRTFEAQPVAVEAATLQKRDFQTVVSTQGIVQARTESTLVPQVSGRIVEVHPSFRNGGFFDRDTVLLRIDPSDYETAVTIARAELARARLGLAEEEALSIQARRDWERLGRKDAPSDLVLRHPQRAEAEATVAAAEARLQQARRNLERTRISVPYSGRVLEQRVDIGQVVTPGTQLGHVYAVDYAEIRLPLSERQLGFVDLPEIYRQTNGDAIAPAVQPRVLLTADFGRERHTWEGRIVRTEGAIDSSTRQLFVIAQVDDPYSLREPGQPPLKVGLFVEAEIEGLRLEDVLVVPRQALKENRYLLVVDGESRIDRRTVEIVWSDTDEVVVEGEIRPGEAIITSQLAFAAEGVAVSASIDGRSRPDARGGRPGNGPPGGVAGRPGGGQRPGGTKAGGRPGSDTTREAATQANPPANSGQSATTATARTAPSES